MKSTGETARRRKEVRKKEDEFERKEPDDVEEREKEEEEEPPRKDFKYYFNRFRYYHYYIAEKVDNFLAAVTMWVIKIVVTVLGFGDNGSHSIDEMEDSFNFDAD